MAEDSSTKRENVENAISQSNLQDQHDELLALESIYEGTGVKRIDIISSPASGRDGQYKLHVNVPIQTEGQQFKVRLTATEDNALTENATGEAVPSIMVKHLPPVELQLILPLSYPSDSPPEFNLSCDWLTTNQISSLGGQLLEMWKEVQGLPVIFSWLDWLENNTLRYDREQEDIEFRTSDQECLVCFEVLPGSHFCRLECGHAFCQDCMAAHCGQHIAEGAVLDLTCPDTDCDKPIPVDVLKNVLSKQDYARWERLTLQKSLESMEDTDWCPRCNNPVIQEPEAGLNLAYCTSCVFAFCIACRDTWHQGRKCETLEDKMTKLETMPANERRKFEEKRLRLVQEIQTRISLQRKTKTCPKCRAQIEKNGGCNLMTCKCGARFCWRCGAVGGYDHFIQRKCVLWELGDGMMQDITPQNIGAVEEMIGRENAPVEVGRCPTCRNRTDKIGRNNHIKCHNCGSNFCFLCKKKIIGIVTKHFVPGGCPQHS